MKAKFIDFISAILRGKENCFMKNATVKVELFFENICDDDLSEEENVAFIETALLECDINFYDADKKTIKEIIIAKSS